MASIQEFERAVPDVEVWLTDPRQRLGWHDRQKVYLALWATLHALRDSLPRDEAVYLRAQLQVLLRGLDYEGWHPSGRIARAKCRSALWNGFRRVSIAIRGLMQRKLLMQSFRFLPNVSRKRNLKTPKRLRRASYECRGPNSGMGGLRWRPL
jgi:uncharacterized protein (DUF2267 family)